MTPKPTVIELLEPDQLLIVWQDGHESLYPHILLRRRCTCASCRERWRDGEDRLAEDQVARVTRVLRWEPVGSYAVRLHFSDGHSSGIFPWTHLRACCPCPDCC